jgi:hypothetical protein
MQIENGELKIIVCITVPAKFVYLQDGTEK